LELQEHEEEDEERTEQVNHYRNLILGNNLMTKSHVRLFDHWWPRIGAPLAYELARVAYNNKRYQLLKGRHALQ
jgi:hypothetical protein